MYCIINIFYDGEREVNGIIQSIVKGRYPASKASVEGEVPSGFAGGGGDASPYNRLKESEEKLLCLLENIKTF